MYYRHYKGNIYRLLHKTQSTNGAAYRTPSKIQVVHTETGEKVHVWVINNVAFTSEGEFAIYQDVKEGRVWARPKKMFFENVYIDGEKVRRFRPITDDAVTSEL